MTEAELSYLGIEIGGTKLQLGIGRDDGCLRGLWRATVDPSRGAEGIREQILQGTSELLRKTGLAAHQLRGVGIGFGGPVDDASRRVIKSHQIHGWDDFPLADWLSKQLGLPTVLGNDADVAGLGEAVHGAGKGLSPIFYITIGSGIGGGLILQGKIHRGVGKGAAEIGHLRVPGGPQGEMVTLESVASGWAIGQVPHSALSSEHTAQDVARLAAAGDWEAQAILQRSWSFLAEGICQVIALLCPRRIVLGGGVSLMGEALLFAPLRQLVAERVFRPFAGLTEIVPSQLGEEVVLHGAIALARQNLK